MTAPRLQADGFHLRGLAPGDLPQLVEVARSPGFFDHIDVPERLRSSYGMTEARAYLGEAQDAWRQGLPTWGIIGDDGLLGTARIRRAPWAAGGALGYGLAPAARGKGIATATVSAILAWCAKEARPLPYARCAPDNAASMAVLRRSGFLAIGVDDVGWYLWVPPSPDHTSP